MDAKYIIRDDNPKSLFNPLPFTFKTLIRGDDNKEVEYSIPSMEIATFPGWIYERLKNDLVTAVINQRGMGFLTEEEKNKLILEIEVNT